MKARYKKRLYRIYKGMKSRCYNDNFPAYEHYGGKGIVVCNEWLDDFDVFEKWAVENGYNDNLTIDRVDSSLNYCPGNCRWITQAEQCRNRENVTFITVEGVEKTLNQLAIESDTPLTLIIRRYEKGERYPEIVRPTWNLENVNGELLELKEISLKYNIPQSTLRARRSRGIKDNDIIKAYKELKA